MVYIYIFVCACIYMCVLCFVLFYNFVWIVCKKLFIEIVIFFCQSRLLLFIDNLVV